MTFIKSPNGSRRPNFTPYFTRNVTPKGLLWSCSESLTILDSLWGLKKEWFLDVFSIDVDALLHKFDISQLTLKSSIKKIEIRIPSRDKC